MNAGFDKTQRLLHREDFLRVQRHGRRFHNTHIMVVFFDRGEGHCRLGLVTSRKVGNAVHRNAIRRCFREVFRLNRELFPSAHDVVIIARDGAGAVPVSALRTELMSVLLRRSPHQSHSAPGAHPAERSRR